MPYNTTAQQLKSDKRSCARQWIITLKQDSLSPSGCRRTFWAFEHPIHRTVAVFDIPPPPLPSPVLPLKEFGLTKGGVFLFALSLLLPLLLLFFRWGDLWPKAPLRHRRLHARRDKARARRLAFGRDLNISSRVLIKHQSCDPPQNTLFSFVCFHNENNKHKMILKEKRITSIMITIMVTMAVILVKKKRQYYW